jgi:leucyl aminopeptidase
MSAINFSTSDSPAKKTSKPQLRVFGAAVEGKNVSLVGSDLLTVEQLQALGVTGKAESMARTLVDQSAIAIIGLGSGDPSIDEWRELGGAIGRGLGDTEALELHLPVSDLSRVEALFEGIALGNYSYEGKADKKAHQLKRVHLVGPLSIDKAALVRVEALASAVHLARNLAARPANLLFPSAFADLAE